MQKTPWRFVGAGLASAILLVLSFPPYSAVPLAFVGLVPLFIAAFHTDDYKKAFAAGFSCMFFFIVLGLSWISFVATNFGGLPWIVGKLVLIAFASFAEPQYLIVTLAIVAFLRVGRNSRLPKWAGSVFFFVLLPLAYVGTDYLYPKIFPITLGQALYHWFSVAQLAEFGGVYGLTIPIVLCNVAVAIVVDSALFGKRKLRQFALPHPALACGLLVALALGLASADKWGSRRIAQLKAAEENFQRQFKFSIVQGNIGDVDKLASERGFAPAISLVLGTYRKMTTETVRRFHPDLVIWPETSYPYLYTHLQDAAANRSGSARDQWIGDILAETNTALYFGAYSHDAEYKRDYNTGFLVTPPFELAGLYRKTILLAFGEYIPLGPFSGIVQDIVPSIANFGRGSGPSVLDLPTANAGVVKLGPQICYEGIVPEFSRDSVKRGAEVLFNITNDSWFGEGTEPELHLLLTAFRSIELRRPMIRGTNTGISTWVDLTGTAHGSTHLFEHAFVEDRIRLPSADQQLPDTFYLRHGELLGKICAAIAVALLAALASVEIFGGLAALL